MHFSSSMCSSVLLQVFAGRVKPGWGRESTKPPWWPVGLPWANVRMDARSEESKHKVIGYLTEVTLF